MEAKKTLTVRLPSDEFRVFSGLVPEGATPTGHATRLLRDYITSGGDGEAVEQQRVNSEHLTVQALMGETARLRYALNVSVRMLLGTMLSDEQELSKAREQVDKLLGPLPEPENQAS